VVTVDPWSICVLVSPPTWTYFEPVVSDCIRAVGEPARCRSDRTPDAARVALMRRRRYPGRGDLWPYFSAAFDRRAPCEGGHRLKNGAFDD